MSWTDTREEVEVDLSHVIASSKWKKKSILKKIETVYDVSEWAEEFIEKLLNKYTENPGVYLVLKFIEKNWEKESLEDEEDYCEWDSFEDWEDDYISEIPYAEDVTALSKAYNKIKFNSSIQTVGGLCELLDLRLEELEFLSDYQGREAKRKKRKLRNYYYKFIPKKNGQRLIEYPKTLLKECQNRILRNVLSHYPVHEAACAYVKEKNIVDFVKTHCGKRIVMRVDIENFFTNIRSYSVQHFFESNQFPYRVSLFLTGLCTNTTPYRIVRKAGKVYSNPHLPQGAPTSPALSNLCFYELDKRIQKAAKKLGLTYTRYADDLAFSANQKVNLTSFRNTLTRILMDGGFKINHRKTRIMSQGQRQRLCNITLNSHPNFQRKEYERLKAIVHNCIVTGPEKQNREHDPFFKLSLLGKINYLKMINPDKGLKLIKKFDEIIWQDN